MKARQNIVGDRVRQLRCEQALTQSELAARCQCLGWQVIRETIIKIEHGTRRVVDAELLLLSQALRCTCADLVGNSTVDALAALSTQRRSSLGE